MIDLSETKKEVRASFLVIYIRTCLSSDRWPVTNMVNVALQTFSAFLIGDIDIHYTGCATLMDAFSFNGQHVVKFSCLEVVDRRLERHSIKPQRYDHQTTDLVARVKR